MPRASASAKRQHGASGHRDTRHENGLVGPGKRISKQKSQSHLNGNVSAAAAKSAAAGAVASNLRDDANAASNPPGSANSIPGVNGHSKIPTIDISSDSKVAEALRRGSLGGYSETSSSESTNSSLVHGSSEAPRRIDVNATKDASVHRDTGILDFALTVVRSCPLQDTIAILIILMQIPPIALSGIYMLFTLLTFVTTSSGLSLSDILEWNLGAPSLATVICVDGFVLLIWLFLWGPIQHVILDLAQMVIALGLGGGSSSRDGGSMHNTLICLSMILLSHGLRHTKMKYSPIGYLLGSSRFMTPDLDDPLELLGSIRGYDKVRAGWFGWVRSILAIHILTQGMVKYIRDWYLRRERRDHLAQNAVDPEAGKPTSTESVDGGFSTPDSDTASLQQSSGVNLKKKRKQSAQIRNRQPLWAALASTKIVVVKEYELTHDTSESAGTNATDIHNLGNAPFNTQPGQIWVSYVGCDEVCFNTSHFSCDLGSAQYSTDSDRVDLSKPFYVKVNNAFWQHTRMTVVEDSDENGSGRDNETRWSGDIYGLTPMSSYLCEFVSTSTHEVLFTTSVRTTQPKLTDIDTIALKSNGQRSLRPDSPITTLKTSIAASEAKLAEEKARQKAFRKEFNRKTNSMKKENEKLASAAQSAGAGDDKLRQKIQQNGIHQKQAEQAIIALETELKEMETIPEELKSEWKAKQTAWNEEKGRYDTALASFKEMKATIDNEVKALEEEKASLQTKRNKINNRIAKVDGEHARIADANARGLDEAERRRQGRAAMEADYLRKEGLMVQELSAAETTLGEKEQLIHNMKAELDAFHSQQAAGYTFTSPFDFTETPMSSSPLPPPGILAQAPAGAYDSASGWNNSLYNASLWGPSPLGPGFLPQTSLPSSLHQQSMPKARGRASSMLSDISGFTEDSVEDDDPTTVQVPQGTFSSHPGRPVLGYPPVFNKGSDEDGSTGSGSPTGSGSTRSNSIRDPTSPPPS